MTKKKIKKKKMLSKYIQTEASLLNNRVDDWNLKKKKKKEEKMFCQSIYR